MRNVDIDSVPCLYLGSFSFFFFVSSSLCFLCFLLFSRVSSKKNVDIDSKGYSYRIFYMKKFEKLSQESDFNLQL